MHFKKAKCRGILGWAPWEETPRWAVVSVKVSWGATPVTREEGRIRLNRERLAPRAVASEASASPSWRSGAGRPISGSNFGAGVSHQRLLGYELFLGKEHTV